jgi:protein involved in polysaccharide export with SLBB domain
MRTCPIGILGAALLLVGVAEPCRAQTPRDDDQVRLQPGDAVRLEVFPSLTRSVPVSAEPTAGTTVGQALDFAVDAEGRVLLPVVGMVQVVGRPFSEVRREVERAYAAEYTDAAVRLTPLLRIAVLGEVRQPGLLPVDPTMTFADVLAAAGGLTDVANRKDIRLVRADGTLVLSDAKDVVGVAVPLRSGDRIVVGHRSWLSANLPFVLGAGASVVASLLTALIVR